VKTFDIRSMNRTDDKLVSEKFKEIFEKLDSLNELLTLNDIIVDKLMNYNNLDQIKLRFRNISQIIDCVSCQKCKLHGKLQVYGLATMFKIIFYNNKEGLLKIRRNEFIVSILLITNLEFY